MASSYILDELEGITSCSEAENTELAKEAANGSAEAEKRLIEGNLKSPGYDPGIPE